MAWARLRAGLGFRVRAVADVPRLNGVKWLQSAPDQKRKKSGMGIMRVAVNVMKNAAFADMNSAPGWRVKKKT